MTRQFIVVQCPGCQEYTYFPLDARKHKCPRCSAPVELQASEGTYAASAVEAQQTVEARQYALHNVRPPTVEANAGGATSEVLRLLRRQQTSGPQWVAIVDVIHHCAKLGLSAQHVKAAVAALVDQGFLELREGSVHATSIC